MEISKLHKLLKNIIKVIHYDDFNYGFTRKSLIKVKDIRVLISS